MSDTYTQRDAKVVTVARTDGSSVTWDDGWSFGGIPTEHRPLFVPGARFLMETRQFSMVIGMGTWDGDNVGEWLWRKSDEQLERDHQELIDRLDAEHEQQWAKKRNDWARREEALPHPLRRRLQRFRANGAHQFEIDGWGYELVVSELATIYARNDGADDTEIDTYAKVEGTSGNQHNMAKALGRLLTSPDTGAADAVANVPSALTPITGDADYSGSRS